MWLASVRRLDLSIVLFFTVRVFSVLDVLDSTILINTYEFMFCA